MNKTIHYELNPIDPAAGADVVCALGKDGDLTQLELIGYYVSNQDATPQQAYVTINRSGKPPIYIGGPVIPALQDQFVLFAMGASTAPSTAPTIGGYQVCSLPALTFRESITVQLSCDAATFALTGAVLIAKTTRQLG